MATPLPTCPLPRSKVIDLYFMEHRAKLLDIAAFLDRIDRAGGEESAKEDFRIAAFKEAVAVLLDGRPQRAKRILEVFSDPTSEPLASAAGMKGASGAWHIAPGLPGAP
jgi:hypothetical protein